MGLHTLETGGSTRKRVGRGGKRGKTSGAGMKGQKSRAGGTPRPAYRDIIKKIPKLRGHGINRAKTFNPNKVITQVIGLGTIAKNFSDGDEVSPTTLTGKGIMDREAGKVKVVANGDLDKKVVFKDVELSAGATEKATTAGATLPKTV